MSKNILNNKIKNFQKDNTHMAEKCLNYADVIMVSLDIKGKITLINKKGYDILGYKKGELINKDWFDTCLPKDEKKQVRKIFGQILKGKKIEKYENSILTKKGELKQISWINSTIEKNRINIIGTVSCGIDITESKKADINSIRFNRGLRMISAINKLLIGVSDEKKLLDEVCRVIVKIGGYRAAWIGYKEYDKLKSIRSVTHLGINDDFIEKANLTWAKNKRFQCPGGIVIRTGKTVIINDIFKDPNMTFWKKDLQNLGFKSLVGLPLVYNKNVFGVILVFSNYDNIFSNDEIIILNELAGDLSFGINTEHIREELIKLKTAVETSGEVVYMTNKEGIITYVNSEFTRLYGYSSQEVVDKVTPRILKSGDRKKDDYKKLWNNLLAGKVVRDEHRNKTKDGKFLIVESTSSPIFIKKRKINGFLAIQRDITENKKIQELLNESSERFKNIFEYSAVGVSLLSVRGHWIEVNNALCKITGYSHHELLSKNFNDITYPDDYNRGKMATRNLLKGKISHAIYEKRYIHKNGHIVWVNLSIALVKDFNGKPLYFVTHTEDISYRKEVENKLIESEFFFKESQKAGFIGSYKTDFVKGVWESSNVLDDIFGIDKNYNRSIKGWSDLIHPDDKKMMNEYLKKEIILNHHQFNKEYRIISKSDGRIKWVNGLGKVYSDKTGKVISMIGTIQDITIRKEIENNLKIAEQKFRRLFEAAKDSILLLDAETGEITDSNPFIQDLLDYSSEELIGKKIYEISPFRDIYENKEKFEELKEKGYVYYDNLPLKAKDGKVKQVEFVSNVYLVGGKKVIQCNIRDITERINKEKELEYAKNDFLSMASHQLRTPLSATKWVLEGMNQNENFTPKQLEKFGYLVQSNNRLINLVNDLLDVTKIESGKISVNKKPTNLNKLIKDLIISLKILADKKNKVIKYISSDHLTKVFCDPILIHEALQNLINNAIIYADSDSKEISISVINRKDDYLVSVHNKGVIDKVSIERIKVFSKFTRGVGASRIQPEGSGLGLYITSKVIEVNGGSVWFESNSEHDTTFYVAINKK